MKIFNRKSIPVILLLVFVSFWGCKNPNDNILLVIARDTSGSTKTHDREFKSVVAALIDQLKEGDVVVPVTFDTYARTLKDRSGNDMVVTIRDGSDKQKLRDAFDAQKPTGAWTYFTDAIDLSTQKISETKGKNGMKGSPIVIFVTDGLSDPGHGRKNDLDPNDLSRIFSKYPKSRQIKFYIVEAGGRTSSSLPANSYIRKEKVLERLDRFNIHLIPIKDLNRKEILSAAVGEIILSARSGSSKNIPLVPSISSGFRHLLGWTGSAFGSLPWKGIGVLFLLACAAGALVFFFRSNPFGVSTEKETVPASKTAAFPIEKDGGKTDEHRFPIPPDGGLVKLGSDNSKCDIFAGSPGIKPVHAVFKITSDSSVRYRLNGKPWSRGWKHLPSQPLNFAKDTSVTVDVEELTENEPFQF